MYLDFLSEEAKSSNAPILLIRHGEKETVTVDEPYHDVPLTEKGIIESNALGSELRIAMPTQSLQIYTSPLRRCVMTSESIAKAIGSEVKIQKAKYLGDPGPFVEDDVLAGSTYYELKNAKRLIRSMNSREHLPGFRTIEDGCRILLDHLILSNTPGLSIHVSHDVIIVALIYHLLEFEWNEDIWIDYLEGVCIYESNGRIMIDTKFGSFDITRKSSMTSTTLRNLQFK